MNLFVFDGEDCSVFMPVKRHQPLLTKIFFCLNEFNFLLVRNIRQNLMYLHDKKIK